MVSEESQFCSLKSQLCPRIQTFLFWNTHKNKAKGYFQWLEVYYRHHYEILQEGWKICISNLKLKHDAEKRMNLNIINKICGASEAPNMQKRLSANRERCQNMSSKNIQKFQQHFTKKPFDENWHAKSYSSKSLRTPKCLKSFLKVFSKRISFHVKRLTNHLFYLLKKYSHNFILKA